MQLYEEALTRRDLAARTGMLSQLAGVQLYTLEDGVERGVRCLEFRTGSGLVFTVLVDRAMDIARCEYRGAAIGWHKDRSVFGDVVGISLLSSCTFRLRLKKGQRWQRRNLTAEPRSVYLLRGPSRTEWEHSIPGVEHLRYSITFRNFLERSS